MKTRLEVEFLAESIADWRDKLCKLIGCGGHGGRNVHLGYTIDRPVDKQSTQPNMPLELSITNEQKVRVTLTPVTDTGKPAKLDGVPTWTVVTGNGGTVEPADDGLSAFLVSSDEPGDTTFMVEADADLGSGVELLQDTILLHTVGATAKNLGLKADQPVPK